MRNIVMGIVGGLIISIVLFYYRIKGVKIDSKQIEKIHKEIRNKPITDVINSLNEWLS